MRQKERFGERRRPEVRAVLEPNRTLLVIDMQVFGWGIGDMIYLDDMKTPLQNKDYA